MPIGKFKKLLSLKQTYDSNPNHIKQKFQSEIAKFLSLLIQNVGEVCNLSNDTNNFKVGTRKSGPIRRAKFTNVTTEIKSREFQNAVNF